MTTSDIGLHGERIACVFGLGGGELHEAHPDFPDPAGWDGPDGVLHWYDGAPSYVSLAEFGLTLDDEIRTAILDVMFGFPEPPSGWAQVATFRSSNEAECWWCGPGSGNEDHRNACKLCEGDGGVYLGDGWCEVVYPAVSGCRC